MTLFGKTYAPISAILLFCLVSTPCVQGDVYYAGLGDTGTDMTDAAPGVEITLDYTSMFNPDDILDVAGIVFLFEAGSWFDRIRIRLSDNTEFTIDDAQNRCQVLWNYYNPMYIDPDVIQYEYKSPITQALKDELMDGVFSAHVWIENDLGDWTGPAWWSFSGQVGYDMAPEPATMGCLLVGGFYLVGKRKKTA